MNEKWLIALLPIVVGLLAIVPVIKAEDITVSASVPTYVSVVFNYNTVDFGTIGLGSLEAPAPGQDQGIYNVSVTTNIPLTISAYRTPWSPKDILTLKFACTFSAGQIYTLSTTSQTVGQVIPVESAISTTDFHYYWLGVPSDALAGTYSTTVTITYQPA
jgi:hypothetical protein